MIVMHPSSHLRKIVLHSFISLGRVAQLAFIGMRSRGSDERGALLVVEDVSGASHGGAAD